MLETMLTANGSTTAPMFSPGAVVTVLVAAAILYPLQKWLRDRVSRQRRERWAAEDAAHAPPEDGAPDVEKRQDGENA